MSRPAPLRHSLLGLSILLAACAPKSRSPLPARSDAASPGPSAAASTPPATSATPATHDPSHPPIAVAIECPLAKAGVDPHRLKPFEDTAKYIAFLERADRAAWQKPDEVVAALGLRGDETVVDLGAGSGYFTFRLARALPRGRVVAVDVEPEMIRHLHHKTMSEGIANVRAVLARPDDPSMEPSIPADTDLVFVCDVLHHVPDRAAWLGRVTAALRPGARLVVIEFKEGKLPEGPPESVKLPRAQLLALAQGAGLTLRQELPALLPYQTFLVFEKAAKAR